MPAPAVSTSADPLQALPASLRKLAASGVMRRYRTHAVLIGEGDQGGSIFIVVSGRLRAFVSDVRGREVTLGYHAPGEYVGEMSLDNGPRSASVEAVAPTVCVVVTRDAMLSHIASDAEFAMGLIVRLIKRARLATESARSMALLDVYSRLRRLLEERAKLRPEGVRRIEERLTHQAIASEIGCSREMVSRLLKDLEAGGYVRVEASRLVLASELPARW